MRERRSFAMIYETRLRVEAPRAGTPKRTPPTADETDGDRGRPSDAAHRMPPIGCRPTEAAPPHCPLRRLEARPVRRGRRVPSPLSPATRRHRLARRGRAVWKTRAMSRRWYAAAASLAASIWHRCGGVPSSRPAIDELRHFHYIDLARALKFNLYQCAPRVVRPKHGGPQRGIHGN